MRVILAVVLGALLAPFLIFGYGHWAYRLIAPDGELVWLCDRLDVATLGGYAGFVTLLGMTRRCR